MRSHRLLCAFNKNDFSSTFRIPVSLITNLMSISWSLFSHYPASLYPLTSHIPLRMGHFNPFSFHSDSGFADRTFDFSCCFIIPLKQHYICLFCSENLQQRLQSDSRKNASWSRDGSLTSGE